MSDRVKLGNYLNSILRPYAYDDYGPNGLQIEGSKDIQKVAFAVSATKDSIQKAIEFGADALVVHHGLFWKFHGPKPLTGPFYERVAPLIKNDINLYAYHLPLDGNLEVGNAKGIADLLGLTNLEGFGNHKGQTTGIKGDFISPMDPLELQAKLESILDHSVIHARPDSPSQISSIGIITGGANSGWKEAAQEGLDAYLTGEISEHDWHDAIEAGIHFYAGGHNATEVFGVQALQRKIQEDFPDWELLFIESSNPV